MKTAALIMAAGKGLRMGADKNKLLIKAGNKTILEHTVGKFAECNLIGGIFIAVSKEDMPQIQQMFLNYPKDITIVEGGDTRTASAANGLNAIDGSYGAVLIHDGARPFVSEGIIRNCIESVIKYGSGITAVPVTDTVKKAVDFKVVSSVERDNLFCMQTPQGFFLKDIKNAYANIKVGEVFTDDSSVYEKYVKKPYICGGETSNVKITYGKDLAFFREGHMVKCGTGYDSHKFCENRKFVLGGANIPYEKGLSGHSDADALIHAVIDSMLSAAGCDDIGTYFPDTSPEYKDINSMLLLKKAAEIIAEKGLRVSNVSCVIICQKPKLAPYIKKMRENISEVLKTGISCIGISAKTNEGMGFTGREEGIAVIANCILTDI